MADILTTMNEAAGRPFHWSSLWKGHLLLFDKPGRPDHSEQTGNRLLWVFVTVGFLGRDAVVALGNFVGIGNAKWFSLVMILTLTLTLVALLFGFAKVRFDQLGLRPWSRWNWTERIYALQVLPAARVIFPVMFASRLSELWAG